MPVIVPSPAEILACARCSPIGRTPLKGLAYAIILFAIAVGVLIFFITPGTIYIWIALALIILIAIFAAVQAFGITLRCGPCLC